MFGRSGRTPYLKLKALGHPCTGAATRIFGCLEESLFLEKLLKALLFVIWRRGWAVFFDFLFSIARVALSETFGVSDMFSARGRESGIYSQKTSGVAALAFRRAGNVGEMGFLGAFRCPAA